jgi:assimilatory nitrate reductase catalytic subunit
MGRAGETGDSHPLLMTQHRPARSRPLPIIAKKVDDQRPLRRYAVSSPGLTSRDAKASCDFLLIETSLIAEVVMPVTQWPTEDGRMTTLEGSVLRRRSHHKPPPGIGTDLAVIAELASRLGSGVRPGSGSYTVNEELRRATAGGAAGNAGVTWERVDAEDGVARLCPLADRAGPPRLFALPVPAVS